jgi:putative glycosyltransferase
LLRAEFARRYRAGSARTIPKNPAPKRIERFHSRKPFVKLSIVTTLYRSSATIEDFCRRALKSAQAIFSEVELVIVNDGSPDNSLELALGLHQHDPRIVVVDLSRNFGHYKAMMTGLAHATGELVFLIDSDLEERPEDLTLFYQRLLRGDSDVVYGVQQTRRGGIVERVGGAVFFALVDALGDRPLPRNLVTARLMTSNYVRALVRHRDREFVISDLWQITGFRQNEIVIQKLSTSPSTYSLWKRIDLALKHLTTASTRLLYLVFYTGLLIFAVSIGIIGYFLLRYVTAGIGVSGFTSLIISIWFLGGLITFILGILGIYLASILSETKRRPYTVVRHVHRARLATNSKSEQALLKPSPSTSADAPPR